MPQVSDIGRTLVEERRRQDIAQRELGDRVGVAQQQIARWEASEYRSASLERVSHVAEELGAEWEAKGRTTRTADLPLAAEESAAYGYSTGVAPVRDLGEVVTRVRANAEELVARFGVVSIAVFGSFSRGEQRDDSDVDLAVDVEPPSPENVFGAERRLAEIMGRRVQAGSLQSINPRVRPRVEEDLVDVWST